MPRDLNEWDLTVPSGLRLRVCEWGAPDGRLPTLILHGFLEQGAAWHEVAQHLPGRVVAPDMRGHGLSGHVGTGGYYHFWDYVPDVLAVIDHLGGRVDLVGHSMGGGVAVLLAALRPDRVRRFVNIEGLGPPDAADREVAHADRFLAAMASPPRHRPLQDLDDAVARMRRHNPGLSPGFARFLASRTTRPEGEHRVWTWDPLHRSRSPTPFRAQMFRKFLAQLQSPVLYVSGGESGFRFPDHAEREAAIPHLETAVLPGAGHLMHHDRPAELAALISEFLADGAG